MKNFKNELGFPHAFGEDNCELKNKKTLRYYSKGFKNNKKRWVKSNSNFC